MNQKLENILSAQELEQIITWYRDENVSLREIERRTRHGRQALAKMLERLEVKTTKGNHYRYYFFDFDFFEKIDSELKAYWLGFLYADGCILPVKNGEQEIQLDLAQQDEDMVQWFKTDLKSTYPLTYDNYKAKKNPNSQVMVRQKLRSQKTVDDLKRLGCVERKSLILKFPNSDQVPLELIRHFIRGYFDGDGSIYVGPPLNGSKLIGQVSFVGTEDFIKQLATYFPNMGSVLPDKRKTNSWYLNIGGNYNIIKIYHFLYDDATRYMKRKHDKFKIIIEQYDESQGV